MQALCMYNVGIKPINIAHFRTFQRNCTQWLSWSNWSSISRQCENVCWICMMYSGPGGSYPTRASLSCWFQSINCDLINSSSIFEHIYSMPSPSRYLVTHVCVCLVPEIDYEENDVLMRLIRLLLKERVSRVCLIKFIAAAWRYFWLWNR